MRRAWIIGCFAALLGVGLLVLPDGEERPEALDLLTPEGDDEASQIGPRGSGGALRGSASAPIHPDEAGTAALPEEPRPTGPFAFLALSTETEAPLAGVLVETEEGDRLGETGPDGRLDLADAGAPELLVRATREDHVPYRTYATAGQIVSLPMQPGIRIAGRVLLAEGGPAARARLRVWDVDLGREIASLQADAEGKFAIPAVRPNRPFLVVTAVEGLVPHRKTENFDVSIDDLEIVVGEGGRGLIGQVSDARGVPVADKQVVLLRADEPLACYRRKGDKSKGWLPGLAEAREARTTTDEDGRYAFRGLAQGDAVQPVVEMGPRFEVRGKAALFRKLEETLERDIQVPKSTSLRIHVVDDAGAPLRHARVEVRAGRALWPTTGKDRQPDGSLLLANVNPGTVRVLASIPGAPGPPDPPDPVKLRPAREETVYVEFPRGLALTGRVRNKRGEPIWRASLSWNADDGRESAQTTTDSRGEFRLQRLCGKPGTLVVSARDVPYSELGYAGGKLEGVAPGPQPLEITLADGTRVRGRFPELSKDAVLYAAILPGTRADAGTLWLDEDKRFSRRGPDC